MVFYNSLNDSKSLEASRTLRSILAVFNNAVVWMVSIRPPTSKSSSPFNNHLATVPKAPITIGIIITFMFHSFFFNSLARFYFVVSWDSKIYLAAQHFHVRVNGSKGERPFLVRPPAVFRISCSSYLGNFIFNAKYYIHIYIYIYI